MATLPRHQQPALFVVDTPPAPEPPLRQIVAEEIARALNDRPAREGMNADEVAAFLGLDRKTVYDYANRGHIPHQRLGKRLLFSRSALMAWLATCKTASARNGG
jgi:excisionase family DNA binding protein